MALPNVRLGSCAIQCERPHMGCTTKCHRLNNLTAEDWGCRQCGMPLDTPKRAHDFIHQQFEALIAHRGEIKRLQDLLESVAAEIEADDSQRFGATADHAAIAAFIRAKVTL